MIELLKRLLILLGLLKEEVKTMEEKPDRNKILYDTSVSFLGKEPTPLDEVDDMVSCVWSFGAVYEAAFHEKFGKVRPQNTIEANQIMLTQPGFKRTDTPKPGNVAVYVTEYRKSGVVHGHILVVGKEQWMSNNSFTGLWEAGYTQKTADAYYIGKLGLTRRVYELV